MPTSKRLLLALLWLALLAIAGWLISQRLARHKARRAMEPDTARAADDAGRKVGLLFGAYP